MLKKTSLFLSLISHVVFADFQYTLDNTNFTVSQKDYMYNYDRFRFSGDYTQENYFLTFIGDGVNYLGESYLNSQSFDYLAAVEADTPFKTQSKFNSYNSGSFYTKLYRLYGGYEDDKNRVVVGLQNITMGVGRIWTPTNLFNPKNIYALEADEVFGVAAISYTRYLNDTSHVRFVTSQKSDDSFKYALRYKAYLSFADFGLDLISSETTKMIGYEIEGNLADSGVELRSEGAYIKHTLNMSTQKEDRELFQAIVGADYGFVNGVTIIGEALYSSDKFSSNDMLFNIDSEILSNLVNSNFYTALSISYSFNIFLDASLIYIESFNDKNSRFISPTLSYTLNDYNSFMIGAQLSDGASGSEFDMLENSYYFKWSLSF